MAIVTGGSRGIGAAIVRRLATDGFAVAFCSRSASDDATALLAHLEEAGAGGLHRIVDVTDGSTVQGFVEEAVEVLGAPSAVVACAGITRDHPLALLGEEQWREVIDTNLTGAYHLCRAVTLPLLRRRAGSIVLIGSVAGTYGNAGQSNYAASKAGLEGLGRSLAKELAGRGIRINVAAPGFIETDMTAVLDPKVRERARTAIPMGRFGSPEDVADLVAFLVSDRSTYVTGQVLGVNGGLTL
ncbi:MULTISPECIES: 3-oxoacyl-ACP reductase FabG [Plantibacter]|uniref:3-oxoacyl-ACP reductase FabG n=1 Tax=Plantibacter TaxID=190323 RepID=UPI001EFF870A|nr:MULTISPECIES: 3-oxoacyl-ACP reductase FabG [Plantibacter]